MDITNPGFDGRSVRCPDCGDYDVADSGLVKLGNLNMQRRKDALKQAIHFASSGARPCITTTCFKLGVRR